MVFLSSDYERKTWCGLESRAIRNIIKARRGEEILPLRMDDSSIAGLFSIDGYIMVGDRDPESISDIILERLEINRASHQIQS